MCLALIFPSPVSILDSHLVSWKDVSMIFLLLGYFHKIKFIQFGSQNNLDSTLETRVSSAPKSVVLTNSLPDMHGFDLIVN